MTTDPFDPNNRHTFGTMNTNPGFRVVSPELTTTDRDYFFFSPEGADLTLSLGFRNWGANTFLYEEAA